MPDQQTQPAACVAAERSILVVDDDPHTRELLAILLEMEGYHVALAEDGAAALRYVQANPLPSCILLDVQMPTMDGRAFHLMHQTVPELAAIPVILMSAHPRYLWTGTDLQVAGYLEKPFPLDDVLSFVEQMMDGQMACAP